MSSSIEKQFSVTGTFIFIKNKSNKVWLPRDFVLYRFASNLWRRELFFSTFLNFMVHCRLCFSTSSASTQTVKNQLWWRNAFSSFNQKVTSLKQIFLLAAFIFCCEPKKCLKKKHFIGGFLKTHFFHTLMRPHFERVF